MTVRITAENLGAAYGGNVIWRDINLDMGEPWLISILGPNGAGKSTFMYMVNKILEPAEGRVLINGEDVMDLTFKDIAKLIAYVPQASGETFAMTVMDTVLMGRYPHSGYALTEEDLEIAADCLEKMHMAEFAMRNFNELSAGQHQRVMIARGLAQEPELLMLDEPTSNLDIYHQIRTMRLLRDIAHQKGIMVLVICHDLNIAAKFSDRIIMFQKGSIYADGTAAEVLTAKTIKDVYNVDADVIEVKGRPYVIYHNEGDVDERSETPGTSPASQHPTAWLSAVSIVPAGIEGGAGVDLLLIVDHVDGDPADVHGLHAGDVQEMVAHRDLDVALLRRLDRCRDERGAHACGADPVVAALLDDELLHIVVHGDFHAWAMERLVYKRPIATLLFGIIHTCSLSNGWFFYYIFKIMHLLII